MPHACSQVAIRELISNSSDALDKVGPHSRSARSCLRTLSVRCKWESHEMGARLAFLHLWRGLSCHGSLPGRAPARRGLPCARGAASGSSARVTCAPRAAQVRFQSLTDKSVLEAEPELFIHMQPDKTNNTLTLRDSGVGMTKADLVNNLGARSARRAVRAPDAAAVASAGALSAAMHAMESARGKLCCRPGASASGRVLVVAI
jgi:hypothetical protein